MFTFTSNPRLPPLVSLWSHRRRLFCSDKSWPGPFDFTSLAWQAVAVTLLAEPFCKSCLSPDCPVPFTSALGLPASVTAFFAVLPECVEIYGHWRSRLWDTRNSSQACARSTACASADHKASFNSSSTTLLWRGGGRQRRPHPHRRSCASLP